MNIRRKLGTILAGAALAATTTLGVASADNGNLLENGDLMDSTIGWEVKGSGRFDTRVDATSELSANAETKLRTQVTAYQCIAADDDLRYTLEAEVRVPQGQERGGAGYITALFYDGDDCYGKILDAEMTRHFTTHEGWLDVRMEFGRTDTHWQPARSLLIGLVVEKSPTKLEELVDQPFVVQFRMLELTASGADSEKPVLQTATPDINVWPPMLETATPDTTLDAATATPPTPAVGGDSTGDPSDDLTGEPSQSDAAGPERQDDGMPKTALAGAFAGVGFTFAVAGVALRKVRCG